MKQNRIIIMCLCIICIIVYTSCYPTGEETYVSEQKPLSSSSEQLKPEMSLKIPNLNADNIVVYDDKVTQAAEITAMLHEFDKTEVNNIFGKDLTVAAENEFSGQNSSIGQNVEFNDGSSFSIEKGRISYYANLNPEYMQIYYSDCGTYGIAPEEFRSFYKSEQLDDFSLKNAKENSDALIELLNMENIKYIGHLAVDSQTVNTHKTEDKFESLVSEWTNEQELYTFIYTQKYNEIPLLDTYISSSVDRNMNVIMLNCNGLLSDFKEKSSKPICSYDEALNTLLNYYDNMILENPTNIKNCMLTYNETHNSDKVKILTPAWTFTVETIVDGLSYPSYMFIDAYTAQVVMQNV